MGALIEIANGVRGYGDYVNHVLNRSHPRTARGLPTRDAGFTVVVLHDVTQSLPLDVGRQVSTKIAALEALQLVGGHSDPRSLVDAAPFFGELLEPDTRRFHGAYGDRIRGQLVQVVTKLREDPGSRQAVITLWDPWLDNQPGKKDYPCTVAIGFEVVRGRGLDMNVTMRSQDVWLGTPYDWFQFSLLQMTVARLLGVEPALYHHTTWSTHIYERDITKLDWLTDPPPAEHRTQQPHTGVGEVLGNPHSTTQRARDLLFDAVKPDELSVSERILRDWLTT